MTIMSYVSFNDIVREGKTLMNEINKYVDT